MAGRARPKRPRTPSNATALLNEVKLEKNIVDVICDDDDGHADDEPTGDADHRLDLGYFRSDDCLFRLLLRKRIVEEDLVLFILGQAGAVDV